LDHPEDEKMPAYVLAEIEITNPDGYKEYSAQVMPTIAKYGGNSCIAAARSRCSKATGPSAGA
jgi:uncharacterized protein (DUF1330 family)